jgi:hypothetical protein
MAVVVAQPIQDKEAMVLEHLADLAAEPHTHIQAGMVQEQLDKDTQAEMLQAVLHMRVAVEEAQAATELREAALREAQVEMAEILVLPDIQHGMVAVAQAADTPHKAMADMAD